MTVADFPNARVPYSIERTERADGSVTYRSCCGLCGYRCSPQRVASVAQWLHVAHHTHKGEPC